MASDVSICNSALAKINASRITVLTESTKAARICNVIFRPSLDFVTRAFPWKCALYRASLTQLAATPAFEWDYQYQLPTDPYCLRVLEMYTDSGEPEYEIEGRVLLTNEGTAQIRYIKRITDYAEIDPSLDEALAYYLAFQLAWPLKGSRTLKNDMWEIFNKKINPLAKSVDSMQNIEKQHADGDWITGRA